MDDLSRFHEAIDQALAESISHIATRVTQSQELFVAVLGHDLRTPLHTVTMVTEYLADVNRLDSAQAPMIARALRSVKRMTRMLDDLVDFTRSRAGMRLAVQPHETDLQRLIEHAVDEFRSNSPRHEFVVRVTGDLLGRWDAPRIAQVLANLLGNAVQYGEAAAPVEIIARGDADEIVLEVCNTGPVIRTDDLPTLCSPFKRLRAGTAAPTAQNLGLGLYIAQQIVTAHAGQLMVSSTIESGTTFAVHLPRGGKNAQAVRA